MPTQCGRLPRHIRRILIRSPKLDNYQRAEYVTGSERDMYYETLRLAGVRDVVRYSGPNDGGLDVYVVAWPRSDGAVSAQGSIVLRGDDVPPTTPANSEATGVPP